MGGADAMPFSFIYLFSQIPKEHLPKHPQQKAQEHITLLTTKQGKHVLPLALDTKFSYQLASKQPEKLAEPSSTESAFEDGKEPPKL